MPVWLDLIGAPSEWAASFLTEEAKEVLEVLGGLVIVFAVPSGAAAASSTASKELIAEVGKVVKDGLGGWEWDGVSLAVGVGEVEHPDDLDTWDELCGDAGLEFVHVAASVAEDTKNEFGGKSCQWMEYGCDRYANKISLTTQRRLEYLESLKRWSRVIGRQFPHWELEKRTTYLVRRKDPPQAQTMTTPSLTPRTLTLDMTGKTLRG